MGSWHAIRINRRRAGSSVLRGDFSTCIRGASSSLQMPKTSGVAEVCVMFATISDPDRGRDRDRAVSAWKKEADVLR